MRPPLNVLIVGGNVGRFGRWPEQSLAQIAVPTIVAALADAGAQVSDIQAVFVGNAFGGLVQGQETMLGQIILAAAGITNVPVHNIKNACSSGADAVHLAWSAVAYGQYDCVLVVGVEKMTHEERSRTMSALASASDRAPKDAQRSVFMDLNAARAQAYMTDYGATPRHFALCAAKNRTHAQRNANAAVREPITVEQVLADRIVVPPLTRAMCGGIADGAATLVLASAPFARQRGWSGPNILASAVVSGDPEGELGQTATARCGRMAFEQSGVSPSDVSVAEVHDPTAPQELFDIEDLGLCARGGAIALLETHVTTLGGRLPVNVSGGLTSRGHPVGATGVAQIVEIARQLAGRAGASQVDGARIGLAQMAGGLLGRDSAVAAVHLIGRREQ